MNEDIVFSPIDFEKVRFFLASYNILVIDGESSYCFEATLSSDSRIGIALAQDAGEFKFDITFIKFIEPYDTIDNHSVFINYIFQFLKGKGIAVQLKLDSRICSVDAVMSAVKRMGLQISIIDPVYYRMDALEWNRRVRVILLTLGAERRFTYKSFCDLDNKERQDLLGISKTLPPYVQVDVGFTVVTKNLSLCVFDRHNAICAWSIARQSGNDLCVYSSYALPEYRNDAAGIYCWYALYLRCMELGLTISTLTFQVDSINENMYQLVSHFCNRMGITANKTVYCCLS